MKFVEVKRELRRTWTLIDNIISPNSFKKRNRVDSLKLHDGTIVESDLDVANAFNNYFSAVGSSIASSFADDGNPWQYLLCNSTKSFFLSPPSIDDIVSYIMALKIRSVQ